MNTQQTLRTLTEWALLNAVLTMGISASLGAQRYSENLPPLSFEQFMAEYFVLVSSRASIAAACKPANSGLQYLIKQKIQKRKMNSS